MDLWGGGDIYIENKEYIKAKNLVLKILENSKKIEYYLKLSTVEYLITKDLDVAENNLPAIKLYEKMGFSLVHRRKGYYQNGKIDALIYIKNT